MEKKELKCRICGCTQDRACAGGCSWFDKNLCTNCTNSDEFIDKKDLTNPLK